MKTAARVFRIISILLSCLCPLYGGVFDTLQPGRWLTVTPLQSPPLRAQLPGWETMVYASAINASVVAGGYFSQSTETQNALMAYNAEQNRWHILDLGPAFAGPTKSDYLGVAGHDMGRVAYDDSMHCFFIYGTWAMGNAITGLCQYDVRGNIGRLYYPGTGGRVRGYGVGACYDPDSGCIYFVGGNDGGNYYTDVTRYRVSRNRFDLMASIPELIGSGNTPQYAVIYDLSVKKMIVLLPSGSVWHYTPASNTWQKATNTHPCRGEDWIYFVYNEMTGKGVVVKPVSGELFSYHAASDTWAALNSAHTGIVGRYPGSYLTYSPQDNLYIYMKGDHWSIGTSIIRSADNTLKKTPPVFSKISAAPDTAWKNLGGALQVNALGWARFPRIINHGGSLYAAWTEFDPANWSCDGGSSVYLAEWSGGRWQTRAKFTRGQSSDYANLISDGKNLFIGLDAPGFYPGSGNGGFRLDSAGRLDTLFTGPSKTVADSGHLTSIFSYRNRIHCLYANTFSTWACALSGSDVGGLCHAVWDESARCWRFADTVLEQPHYYNTALDGILQSPFSTVVSGDSVIVAYTGISFRNNAAGSFPWNLKPYNIGLRYFNGTVWRPLPGLAENPDSVVTTHPCLAADTARRRLYLAYLRRPFTGRRNNELFVDRFTGTGWEHLGGPLNVNGPGTDAWAFRPGLAVNSRGDLYVAWTEHVWGSCPQVYVAHWDGSQWIRDVRDGASLNIDGTDGSAQSVSLAFASDTPVVAWCEHAYGTGDFRKVHVKRLGDAGTSSVEEGTAGPQARLSLSAAPNPSRSAISFVAGLPLGSADVSIAVYNSAGRLVWGAPVRPGGKTLLTIRWQTLDRLKRPVPAGIYLVRLKTENKSLTKKIVIAG